MTISVKKSIEGSKINFSILQEGINNFFFKDKTKHVNIVEGKNLLTTKTHYFCKKKKKDISIFQSDTYIPRTPIEDRDLWGGVSDFIVRYMKPFN
jgi:hypothetical protein